MRKSSFWRHPIARIGLLGSSSSPPNHEGQNGQSGSGRRLGEQGLTKPISPQESPCRPASQAGGGWAPTKTKRRWTTPLAEDLNDRTWMIQLLFHLPLAATSKLSCLTLSVQSSTGVPASRGNPRSSQTGTESRSSPSTWQINGGRAITRRWLPIRSGDRRYVPLDQLHLENLKTALAELGFPPSDFPDDDLQELNRAWESLPAWPDSVEGVERLKARYIVGPLSNANTALLVNMAKYARLPWDVVILLDLFQTY